MSDLYYQMLNTATAVHISVTAAYGPYSTDVTEPLKREKETPHLKLLAWRHPDFEYVVYQKITNTDLQVRGSWNRLYTKDHFRPQGRSGHLSWVWNSHLYILGGRSHRKHKKEPKELMDFWYSIPLRLNIY